MSRDYTMQRLKWCETGKKGNLSALYLSMAFVLNLPKDIPNPKIDYGDSDVIITWQTPTHTLSVCTDVRGFTVVWAGKELSRTKDDLVAGWNACLDFIRTKLVKEKDIVNEIP